MLEEIFRELAWEEKGLDLNGRKLSNLRFADDATLVADSFNGLRDMIFELNTKSKMAGLSINFKKSSTMSRYPLSKKKIIIEDKEIKAVKETTYPFHPAGSLPFLPRTQ